MRTHSKQLHDAEEHLRRNDPVLAPVIAAVGPCQLRPQTDYYGALVSAIIGQQLSVKAAAAIRSRLLQHYHGNLPSPVQILETNEATLRSVGLSGAKVRSIRDLAEHCESGKLVFSTFHHLSNQEIADVLVPIFGIGTWTVHMFLIFCVGRLDVLPTGDLGIRSGVQSLYQLPAIPTPNELSQIALSHQWSPYQSVASWYVWRSLEILPS